MLKAKRIWETWDEPDRAIAVAVDVDRDIAVVFPIDWAAKHGQALMIGRAKDRIAEVEAKSGGKHLEKGSVLLAFSEHEDRPQGQLIIPEINRRLI
jgi:hypothetical protein